MTSETNDKAASVTVEAQHAVCAHCSEPIARNVYVRGVKSSNGPWFHPSRGLAYCHHLIATPAKTDYGQVVE